MKKHKFQDFLFMLNIFSDVQISSARRGQRASARRGQRVKELVIMLITNSLRILKEIWNLNIWKNVEHE